MSVGVTGSHPYGERPQIGRFVYTNRGLCAHKAGDLWATSLRLCLLYPQTDA